MKISQHLKNIQRMRSQTGHTLKRLHIEMKKSSDLIHLPRPIDVTLPDNPSFKLIHNAHTSHISLALVGIICVIIASVCVHKAETIQSTTLALKTLATPQIINISGGTEEVYMPEEGYCELNSVFCEGEEIMWRIVTAYNPVPEQTDGDPCISANGTDICEGMKQGKKYVATNEFPFGTKVEIAGAIYEVVDRSNSRYGYRYDIAMPENQVAQALEFGNRTLAIKIIE